MGAAHFFTPSQRPSGRHASRHATTLPASAATYGPRVTRFAAFTKRKYALEVLRINQALAVGPAAPGPGGGVDGPVSRVISRADRSNLR
jgi:hypothetical protein